MSRRSMLRARRGSALILVLLMTLAVAALAIAAIFMSSSAGLLSRFYDTERGYRLAAESALEIVISRLEHSATLGIPDTGMRVLATGMKIATASGNTNTAISVDVYGAMTGDTSGAFTPHVSLIARAWDASGTRHVRRVDLRRESFSRYQMFVDSFPSGLTFGPGVFAGRVHANQTWRSGGSAATAGVYLDSLTSTAGFVGTATYSGDTVGNLNRAWYPRDSTYQRLDTLANAANLRFAPVTGSGSGWVRGSRLEFVSFDANANGNVESGEGYLRIFDLASGVDTSRIRVSLDGTTSFIASLFPFTTFLAKIWSDPIVQNQCGAFYYRDSRWQFFPVSTHRATWARNVINRTGGSNYPAVPGGTMNNMDDYDYNAVNLILSQETARCFPAGSPYLMPSERMTNGAGVVTNTASDTRPWGVVTPSGGWPASSPQGYGGVDTSFTRTSRSCVFSTGGTSGECDGGTIFTLGTWRAFGGTAVTGIGATVRQALELPFLWPFAGASNAASRGVVRATGGPLFVSGLHRGRLTLVVDGSVIIIDQLEQVKDPGDPNTTACDDQLGIVATGDILVANSALFRARRVAFQSGIFSASSFTKHMGAKPDASIHAQLMSLTGTVGTEGNSVAAVNSVLLSCPADAGGNVAAGCFRLIGGAAMRTYSQLYNGNNTGMRWAGVPDRCQATNRRPPFFPLTNRYTWVRALEIRASRANNPTKIRAILMALKGKTL